jgi:hypothetical protein
MADETIYMPDWLAALRCPMCGDVGLSRSAWEAPDHIPEVLQGFGPRHPPARRYIVLRIDRMADDHWFARNHEPAFGLKEAKVHFASTISMAKNGLNKLRDPWVRRAILMANAKRKRTNQGPKWLRDMDLDAGTPLDAIDVAFKFIKEGAEEILLDPDIYYRLLGRRVAESRKGLERALLWEPLLDLMRDFGIGDFGAYQDLIHTVRSLHLALGIDPPDANLLKQIAFRWRKCRLNSVA